MWGGKNLSCSFYLYRFSKYVSYGFPIINICNLGVHYETPCVLHLFLTLFLSVFSIYIKFRLVSNYEGNTFVFNIVRYLGDGAFKLSVLETYRRLLYSVFIGGAILPAYTTCEDGTNSVPKRRNIKFRRRGITQKTKYNIQNAPKV